ISLGIIPLVSLQDLELEEISTWQWKTHKPDQQRKRQEKADKVRIKIGQNKFRLTANTTSSRTIVPSLNMALLRPRQYMGWITPNAEDWTVCRNKHSVPLSSN